MRVAVAGGTGVVGRHVVAALAAAGHEPTVLARARGVDLVSGAGLADALRGVDTVIDVSNVTSTRRRTSVDFFARATGHLLEAGRQAGVRHHVALSIVGVDAVNLGYYEGKRRQEELVRADAARGTVLRATQFHEFAEQVLAQLPGPLALVPTMRMQPIAAREVGQALADLVTDRPSGLLPDLGGPQEESLVDLARQLVQATGRRKIVVPVRLPGGAGRAWARGAAIPQGAGPRGSQTFGEWLAENTSVAVGR